MGLLAILGRGRDQEPLLQLPVTSAEKWPLAHSIPWTQEPTPASHLGEAKVEESSCHSLRRCFRLALLPSALQYAVAAARELLCPSLAGVPSYLQSKGEGVPLNETAFLPLAGNCSPNEVFMSGEVSHVFLP